MAVFQQSDHALCQSEVEEQADLDMAKLRLDTPGVANGAYLHNAGAGLMPSVVASAMKEHIDLESSIGGYAAAEREADRLQGLYSSIGSLINAESTEIAVTENATNAWQMAFYSIPFTSNDRILTAQAEYAANYVAYLQMQKRTGVQIEIIPNDDFGEIDTIALENMLDENVKLIAITWIPTNGGLINPAEEVGQIARKYGILYLLDACQAIGQIVVNVRKLNCDMLSATGRKFLRGPRGTGFLYYRKDMLNTFEPPMIDHFAAPWTGRASYSLRKDARRFETWENNYAARLGLDASIQYAMRIGIDRIRSRCLYLSTHLRNELKQIPGLTLRDAGRQLSSIVSFSVEWTDAQAFVDQALKSGITIGISSPAGTRIDAEVRGLPPIIRASPHYYNTVEEVNKLIAFCNREM